MSMKPQNEIELPIKRTESESLKENLSENAYNNILPARYLLQNSQGETIEEQEELFERVAKNIALAEVVYKSEEFNTTPTATPEQIKEKHKHRDNLVREVFGVDASVEEGEIIPSGEVTVELDEDNINKFSYDTIVPEIENDKLRAHVERTKERFRIMMEKLEFIPNSPTLMNAGGELQQLSACFVNSPRDDLEDIHDTAKEAALVFQSGGGLGYSFSNLRPYGDPVGSTGGIASGPITFMRTYDQMTETIAQGGTRRGAQMGVMRVSHPDIIQFIHSKNKDVSLANTLKLNDPDDSKYTDFTEALDEARGLISEDGSVPEHLRNAVEGHLSNFNISVGVTDDFMEALKNDEDYELVNPRTGEVHIATEETKELYSRFGLGDEIEVGEPLKIPAEEIWDRIITGSHQNGEPGVIFIDRMNKEHSFPVESTPDSEIGEYEILATNPCGEQELMEYEACNLGHINLSTIAEIEAPDWRTWEDKDEYSSVEEKVKQFLDEAIDWENFNERIEKGSHFLENVVTMSDFPLDKIEETVRSNRKIGLGVMGLAQLYIQLGLKYGSEEADEVARQLMLHLNHESKEVSRKLANDRGVFENWEDSKFADPTEYKEWFKNNTGEEAEDWENGYPIRNHNTTVVAPTGTTSMVGNTSGGIEPIFSVAYFKNVSDDIQGDEMLVEFDDYFLRTLKANDIDVEAVKDEALEQMLNDEFDGIKGLENVPDMIGELFVTADKLSALEHASVQTAAQEGIDAAISKTINAPAEATKDDADKAFRYVYENGGKGVTYYRDSTRSKQVMTTSPQNKDTSEMDKEKTFDVIEEILNENPDWEDEIISEFFSGSIMAETRERPDRLSGDTQRIETGYGKVYVTINEDEEGRPFELFANIGHSGGYTNSFTESLAKVVSIALRSGVNPDEIIDELTGTRSPKLAWDKTEQILSIPDAIGKALRRNIEGEDGSDDNEDGTNVSGDSNSLTESSKNKGETGDTQSLIEAGEAPECPECGSIELYYSEGCKTCKSCGWSECS